MTRDPDYLIIDRILGGETDAYAILVNRYKRYVYAITLKIIMADGEAEEAAQDAFLKAFNALKNFNRESKFSTWLYRIAFNTAVSYQRRAKRRETDIEGLHITSDSGESGLEKEDKMKFIHKAMERMSESDRSVLSLFYLQEFSLDEIAEITQTPANTIKVRIHRARVRLADELKRILKTEALTL
ncbi:MAG TPA: sigma-70 family RNA polymerase sigma factor [Chryseosolibacter sp.]|nr:sigma-70 family RNA polymerase sigma factor [Chryseosolibacter sp.]